MNLFLVGKDLGRKEFFLYSYWGGGRVWEFFRKLNIYFLYGFGFTLFAFRCLLWGNESCVYKRKICNW